MKEQVASSRAVNVADVGDSSDWGKTEMRKKTGATHRNATVKLGACKSRSEAKLNATGMGEEEVRRDDDGVWRRERK